MINLAYRNRTKYGHLVPKWEEQLWCQVAISWSKVRVQLRKKMKVDIEKDLADSTIPTKAAWFTANF